MFFFSEAELGMSFRNDVFVYMEGKDYDTDKAQEALDVYANTRCPASQLIEAETELEMLEKKLKMVNNFKDLKFIEELMEVL
jgi:uncharacterized OsmC-like protein